MGKAIVEHRWADIENGCVVLSSWAWDGMGSRHVRMESRTCPNHVQLSSYRQHHGMTAVRLRATTLIRLPFTPFLTL